MMETRREEEDGGDIAFLWKCKYELFTVCNTVFQFKLQYLHASMKLSHCNILIISCVICRKLRAHTATTYVFLFWE